MAIVLSQRELRPSRSEQAYDVIRRRSWNERTDCVLPFFPHAGTVQIAYSFNCRNSNNPFSFDEAMVALVSFLRLFSLSNQDNLFYALGFRQGEWFVPFDSKSQSNDTKSLPLVIGSFLHHQTSKKRTPSRD